MTMFIAIAATIIYVGLSALERADERAKMESENIDWNEYYANL